jgi:hypothetical protein
MRDGKVESVIAIPQLRDVGIAMGIVDELMMRQMMHAILVRRRIDRKGGQPIRRQLIETLVGKQKGMRPLVNRSAKLMLGRTDDEDGEEPFRRTPPQ